MSNELKKLEIDLDGIGHAMSDRKLTVPVYQRSYAWEEKHVNDLITDLFSSIRNSEDEYFIGSVVISSANDSNEVVDGQQRLATISILIAAIRDYFYNNDDKDRASDIHRDYLATRDRRTQETVARLKLNNNDHNYFYRTIVSLPDSAERDIPTTRESHIRLKNAYSIARKSINSYLKTSNNPTTSLLDLLEFIDDHLKVIWVQVPNHSNAFTIFETLNDRGLDLAISDLLKNYIFGQSEDRINEAQSKWTEMYSMLESTENEELVVTFIRHYWSSIYGLTRERVLYNEIKRRITSKQRAVDLAINLAEHAKQYVALIDSSSVFWSEYSPETRSNITTLNLFRMIQVRPLLIAILSKFSKKEVEKSIRLLVNTSVRFLIHGGLGGGALETQYSERAKEVNSGEINTTEELLNRMKKAIPTDSQFEASFKQAAVSKQYLARYYLICLENIAKGGTEQELVPNSDATAVNLEHVLPKAPDDTWSIDEENHKLLVNRIGNLALMRTKLNSDVGNSSFESKKSFYSGSEILLTKKLADSAEWNKDEINLRQNYLAELAVKAWPLK